MHSCGLEVHGPSVQLQYNLKHHHKGKMHSESLPRGCIQHSFILYIIYSQESLTVIYIMILNCIYDTFSFIRNVSVCNIMNMFNTCRVIYTM